MGILHTFTSFPVILTLQTLLSVWFAYDFFLGDESSTTSHVFGTRRNKTDIEVEELFKSTIHKYCSSDHLNDPSFDKLVLIVIDALGADFIPLLRNEHPIGIEASMPFVESHLGSGEAIGFVAAASTPTVTMPRLKALLGGSIPSFLDIAYNLAADVSDFKEENLISIAKAHNKSIVFYGDDTWLSLFRRDTFTRVEETYSFFASDYTTVDTNVTRNAIPETEPLVKDWDFLILHYLGLDHIGHVFGTNKNEHINKKLSEMDSVISKIHKNLSDRSERSLIVIVGDHGMSPEGNHGGGSSLESNTALIFMPINQKFRTNGITKAIKKALQIDLAATLLASLGMPIPKTSRGVMIDEFLSYIWSDQSERKTCIALRNLAQLIELTKMQELDGLDEVLYIISTLKKDKMNEHTNIMDLEEKYLNASREVQRILLRRVTSRRPTIILLLVVASILLMTVVSMHRLLHRSTIVTGNYRRPTCCILSMTVPILMQGSTDFLEYEHVFWSSYSVVSLLALILTLIPVQRVIEGLSRVDRVKLVSFPFLLIITLTSSIRKRFESLLSSDVALVLALILFSNYARQNLTSKKYKNGLIAAVIGILIGLDKFVEDIYLSLQTTNSLDYRVAMQRFCLLLLLVLIVVSRGPRQGLYARLTIYNSIMAMLLSRRHNIVFIVCNLLLEIGLNSILVRIGNSQITRVAIYVNFAQAAFYCQGNSNLFTTIDVNPAFFAQRNYNLTLATFLVIFSTFSTQILWFIKLFQRFQEEQLASKKDKAINVIIPHNSIDRYSSSILPALILYRNFFSLCYYLIVCLILRNHLFIWSVISPKLVYHSLSNFVLILVVVFLSKLSVLMSDNQNSSKAQQTILAN